MNELEEKEQFRINYMKSYKNNDKEKYNQKYLILKMNAKKKLANIPTKKHQKLVCKILNEFENIQDDYPQRYISIGNKKKIAIEDAF